MLSYPEKNDFVEAGNWKTNQKERNERNLSLPKSFTVIIRHLLTLLIKPNFHINELSPFRCAEILTSRVFLHLVQQLVVVKMTKEVTSFLVG